MIAVVLVHLILAVWAWPWFSRRDKLWILLLLGLFAPIISWPVLAPLGVIGWSDLWVDRREQRLELERQCRQEAVCFLRDQLVNGTPVEQENAREVLAMWSVPEIAPPAEEAPLLLHTDRPQDVRREGDWLVVGGLPRAHVDPPTLERYDGGCRCPGCTHLYREVQKARRANARQDPDGFALAIASVQRQICAGLSLPPAVLAPHEECPDCEWEVIQQMNGRGEVCVTHRILVHRCPWHAG